MTIRHKLLILDLDGTLRRCNVAGQPCPNKLDEQVIIPEAIAEVRRYVAAGAAVAFASNQGGIPLGYMTNGQHYEMARALAAAIFGVGADEVSSSLKHDEKLLIWHDGGEHGDVRWLLGLHCGSYQRGLRRKPAPGMLWEAMLWAGARPEETLFVGDMETDRQAAEAAGCDFEWANEFNGEAR